MKKDKPSRTARKVALSLLALSHKPGMERILPPGTLEATERLILAGNAAGPKIVKWCKSPRMLSIYEAFDWMMPGQFEALGHRKAFFEHHIRNSLIHGATQVLVLGAGYDTTGYRLGPEFPKVCFFEIDHPATAILKEKGLNTMERPDNLILLAKDLGRQNLVDVLKSNSAWDAEAQTVISAEGLLMYLDPETVRDLFLRCAEVVGPNSRIIFSYLPSGKNGRPDCGRWSNLMLYSQKLIGEPWLWSIKPNDLAKFLKETGWKLNPSAQGTIQKRGVEYFVVAQN